MKATDTFRNPAYGHNCAQAVANKWKDLYRSTDIVSEYAPYVGGRAPEGLCGALFAAIQAVPDHADEIKAEFAAAEQKPAVRSRQKIKLHARSVLIRLIPWLKNIGRVNHIYFA